MRRCACRPGCLSWIGGDDEVVGTVAGDVLVEHSEAPDAYPIEPLFELSEVTS